MFDLIELTGLALLAFGALVSPIILILEYRKYKNRK